LTLATTWINDKEKFSTSLEELMPIISRQLAEGKSVRFTPTGNSMAPMLRHNEDVVILSSLPEELNLYDLVLYKRDSGSYVLHRIVGTFETSNDAAKLSYIMLGDNQYTKEYGIDHSQIIGVVTSFVRDGREHSVEENGYKAYCRVWYHSRHFRYFWLRVKRKIRRLIG